MEARNGQNAPAEKVVEGYAFGLSDDQIEQLSRELAKLLNGDVSPDDTIIAPANFAAAPQLVTNSASDERLVWSEKKGGQLWTNAVGKAPKEPEMSEENEVKFAVLIDMLNSNTNPKELRLQLEQLASVNQEMMEWREYELRAEAARKVYARMESERLNHPWNVFKRKVKGWFSGSRV